MIRKNTHTLFMLILSLVVLPACSMDEDSGAARQIATDDHEMRFGIDNATAGGAATRAVGDLDKVGIYGYYTATERWGWASDNIAQQLKPNYFCNTPLERSGVLPDYVWNHSEPPRLWPPDVRNKVSFFAYAPYVATLDGGGNEIDLSAAAVAPSPAKPTDKGEPKITFTQPSDPAKHIDLMYASSIDLTWHGADGQPGTPDDGVVPFVMKHALTQIAFTASFADNNEATKGYTVKVTKIEISDIHTKGELNFTKGWSGDPTLNTLVLSAAGGHLTTNPIAAVHPAAGDVLLDASIPSLMLIPQSLENAILSFTVELEKSGVTRESVLIFRLNELPALWEEGNSIVYNLRIKADFITILTTYVKWNKVTTDQIDIEI